MHNKTNITNMIFRYSQFFSCTFTWVCLKIVYPIVPNGFADHYPYEKWLFYWGYTPFSDIPTYFYIRSWCSNWATHRLDLASYYAPSQKTTWPTAAKRPSESNDLRGSHLDGAQTSPNIGVLSLGTSQNFLQIIPNFRHSQISSHWISYEYPNDIPWYSQSYIPCFFMDTMINLQNSPPAVSSKQLCSSSRKVDLVDGCGLKNWTVPGKDKGHFWNYGTLMMTIGCKLITYTSTCNSIYIYINTQIGSNRDNFGRIDDETSGWNALWISKFSDKPLWKPTFGLTIKFWASTMPSSIYDSTTVIEACWRHQHVSSSCLPSGKLT